MALGLSNGDGNGGLIAGTGNGRDLALRNQSYGASVQNTLPGGTTAPSIGYYGVTTDPTKSGIVVSFSNITLGGIPSLQLGKFFIKC